ncbi:uncharacterized protein I206_101333 [Kwoniella pini CBS 10737]|uniref:MFS transporter, SP family, solute carrier family 2 (Myo-inositol transporter), member 13 n=1 Tax=Kwoniella pini CBS 10737 TaxID=1296096 RepID=A0A1B9HWZ7_9TREE|nr:MFS transporter, SP family, solute carrier family 2 (myo-inositol transporter), member 13 [Kwoniella pini CBS 10737]OCF47792.1 MFS transporter, SP family, solute carrier family 2 (myo-inositol transporter), member 13 [Kwoniella pini CBS 10737]
MPSRFNGNTATADDPNPHWRKGPEVEHVEWRKKDNQADLADESLVQAEDEDKVTPYLIFLILVAALGGFLFGYDTGVVGSALPLVGTDLGGKALSSSEQEIVTAGTTIGAIFGAAILGPMADRLGRKWSLFIADVFFTTGAVIIASSYSLAQIIVGRLVLGVGVGAAALIAPLYITELAPTAVRGRCIGINAFFIPFGQVVSSAVGSGVQTTKHGWRILFALGVVPSIVQLSLMHFLPESPRVLILRGEEEKAAEVFAQIYKKATPEILDLKLSVARSYVAATTSMQRELTLWERSKRLWTHKPYRRAIISVSGLQIFSQLTGFNTLLYYSGTLFGLLGFSNPAAAGLIPSGINAVMVFIGMSIVDKVGRRRLVLIFAPVMMAGLVWASVAAWYMTADTNHRLLDGYEYDHNIAGALIGGIVLFVVGYGLCYSYLGWYQSEFLALEIRASGSGISTVAVWVANLVVSVSYLSELENITPTGTFCLYLGFSVIGYVFVYFCYPESKGISVDEIAKLFTDDFGVRKSEAMRAGQLARSQRVHSQAVGKRSDSTNKRSEAIETTTAEV